MDFLECSNMIISWVGESRAGNLIGSALVIFKRLLKAALQFFNVQNVQIDRKQLHLSVERLPLTMIYS